MSLVDIRQKALDMSPAERASLAHDLLASIDPGDEPLDQAGIDAAQGKLAQRRLLEAQAASSPSGTDAREGLANLRRELTQ